MDKVLSADEVEILKQVGFVGDTVTILHGKALEQKYPNVIVIEGDIETVKRFIDKRITVIKDETGLQFIDKNKAVVFVNKDAGTIELHLDSESPFGAKVGGKLEDADELKQFRINGTSQFNRKEFIKLLKFNKRFFFDEAQHKELLTQVETFTGNATVGFSQADTTRGNKQNHFDKAVKTNIPESVTLSVPLFKGQPKEKFRVDVCIDVTEAGGLSLWFESVELIELIELRKEALFAEQLSACSEFVIVNL